MIKSGAVVAVVTLAVLPVVLSALIPSDRGVVGGGSGREVMVRDARARDTFRAGDGVEVAQSGDHHGGAMSSGGGDKETSKKKKGGGDLMSKILPFMVMPFLISSSMIPMALTSLKMMLLKSLFVGKIAIFLLAVNFLWRSGNKGGVYSHNVNIEHDQKELIQEHYGYNGDEEYGNYVNRRGFRKYR